jgi:antitoxin (DNA-binding transcriptional repressor) of toxin-antitoxin stability system
MRTASVREIRHDFGRVLSWIEQGEQVEITKRKQVVARLVPAKSITRGVKWPNLEARRRRIFPAGVKGKPVSDIVDEGRGEY